MKSASDKPSNELEAVLVDHIGEAALPAKQMRSRATRDRLIAAGLEQIERQRFEDVSIASIAAAAGCSVGTFYFRFSDKDAFFDALIQFHLEDCLRRWHELIDGAPPELDEHSFICHFIAGLVDVFRQRRALIRAALIRGMSKPESWDRHRAQVPVITTAFTAAIAARRGSPPTPALLSRVRIGFQLVFGTLNNLLLYDPGPMHLDERDLDAELVRAVESSIIH